jgi:hypothetical protein
VILGFLYLYLNYSNCNQYLNYNQFRNEPNPQESPNDNIEIINDKNLLRNHHWDTWNPKLETIEKYLEKELRQLPTNTDFVPNRSKKNKKYNNLDESTPLIDQQRKTGDDLNSDDTCSSKFVTEKNVMIDSKTSVKKGAVLLNVEKIQHQSRYSLKELEKSCMKLCCSTDECDSSILSLKLGEEGYRCYLFKCNGNCFYIKHDEYVISRVKLPEEIEKGSPDGQVITTGHRENNDHSSEGDSFNNEFVKVDNYAPEDKAYFTDKSKAAESNGNVTMAVLVLVLGISCILAFFAYLFASTKYFNRKLKWFSQAKESKQNIDVDGDYLINGMYL